MLSLKHLVKIGDLVFSYVKEAQIQTTRESIADVMTLKLPKYRKLKPGDIKEGDRVIYKCGYNEYGIFVEFDGFVSSVSPNQPYTIECHDYFGELKKHFITKTFRRMYCSDIIASLLSDYDINLSNVQKGKKFNRVIFRRKSLRWILQYLAKASHYDAYFRGKDLYFCWKWHEADALYDPPVFKTGHNVINDSDLTFLVSGKYGKITVLSEKTDGSGKIIKASYGSGSNEKKIFMDDLDIGEARKIARAKYNELNYTGFRGAFETFGYPTVSHSQKVNYEDKSFSEKFGFYRVKSVEKTIGVGGYRQKILLQEREVE